MIKGINQNIIEIKDIQNTYYDRAILFLKPEYAEKSISFLEKEAKIVVKSAGKPSYIKKETIPNKIIFKTMLYTSIFLSLIVGTVIFIQNILWI